MSLLDRNYAVEISLKDGKMKKTAGSSFEIYNTDKDIFNIYVTLKDNTGAVIENADLANYETKIYIVRPDLAYKEVTCQVDGSEDRLVVDLGADVLMNSGSYKFEFAVKNGTEIVTSSSDTFNVKDSIITGLTQTYSMDIAVLSALEPVTAVAELQSKKIDDVRFDGKILYFYADGECVRKCYLNKADIPLDELETYTETYTAGNGINISKNNVISLNTNTLKAIIRQVINEGEGE